MRETSLKLLNYISFGAVCLATVISLFIPRIKFKKPENNRKFALYVKKLVYDLKKSYSQMFIVKWSIWWAISTCLFIQIGNYVQVLWSNVSIIEYETHNSTSVQTWNGLAEALNTLLGEL